MWNTETFITWLALLLAGKVNMKDVTNLNYFFFFLEVYTERDFNWTDNYGTNKILPKYGNGP